MKTLLKMVAFAFVAGVLLYGFGALAANGDAFNTASTLMQTTFKNVRMIVYIFGAFGLIGLAVGAIMGKVNYKWLAALAIGLAIVAGADLIVRYATQNPQDDHKAELTGGYEDFKLK